MPRYTEMKPDLHGVAGKAWKASYDPALPISPEHSEIVGWVIHCPRAHPFWEFYGLSLIHLRDQPGAKPAIRYLRGATHEIVLHAVNPDHPPMVGEPLWPLVPMNYVSQFIADTDDDAAARVEQAVRDVVDGKLSPDTDFRSMWKARFGDCMFKKGDH